MLPRSRGSSSRITGAGWGSREHPGHRRAGALGDRHHRGAGGQRRELLEHLPVEQEGPRQPGAEVGGEGVGQLPQFVRVAGDEQLEARTEPERVLDRVEAFEHRQRRVAAGTAEARDQLTVLHGAIIPAGARVLELATMRLEGVHHITAITGDAPGNVEFYTGLLGLRMVKRTVNQDDPTVYHLFYGDEDGSPGMDLTFFEYPGAAPGRAGAGMIHRILWRVGSPGVLDFWGKSGSRRPRWGAGAAMAG